MTLDSLRRQILAARDGRASAVERLSGALPPGRSLVFLSLNIPGPDKNGARLDGLFASARAAVLLALPDGLVAGEGRDALGPWAIVTCEASPVPVKRLSIALEESLPAGRLLDIDVYDAGGRPVTRGSLGLPPRRCLACGEPAVDCIRLQRHPSAELAEAAGRLAG